MASIDLSWSDNSDNENGFEIYRSQDGTKGSSLTTVGSNSTSYSDTGLEDGELYYYTVEAYTEHTASASGQSSSTTSLPSPGTPSLDNSVEGEVSLSWAKNDDSPDGNMYVYRSTDGTTGSSIATLVDSATSYTDTGLSDGEQYYYTIRRSTDHVTEYSGQQSTITRLPDVTDLSVSNITADSADLSWSNPENNATEKRVYLRQPDSPSGMEFQASNDDFVGTGLYYDSEVFSNDISFGCWVYDTGNGNSGARPMSTDLSDYWGFYQNNGSGTMQGRIETDDGTLSINTTFSLNTWTHLFFVLDMTNGAYYLYKNGSQDGSGSTTATQWGDGARKRYLNIGSGAESTSENVTQTGTHFDGRIADVRVHNTALSQSEVNDIYNGSGNGNAMAGHWPLDINRSGTTPDLSGFANDGTVNGATLTGPTVSNDSGSLSSTASSYSFAGLTDGEEYEAYLHTLTDHNEVRDT